MCRNRMCNNFIVEGIYKKDPLINPSVTANASHVRHNDFQRPNRIFTSQIFDDLKLLPLPVTNSFCEPLPFTRYPFFSRATIGLYHATDRQHNPAYPPDTPRTSRWRCGPAVLNAVPFLRDSCLVWSVLHAFSAVYRSAPPTASHHLRSFSLFYHTADCYCDTSSTHPLCTENYRCAEITFSDILSPLMQFYFPASGGFRLLSVFTGSFSWLSCRFFIEQLFGGIL